MSLRFTAIALPIAVQAESIGLLTQPVPAMDEPASAIAVHSAVKRRLAAVIPRIVPAMRIGSTAKRQPACLQGAHIPAIARLVSAIGLVVPAMGLIVPAIGLVASAMPRLIHLRFRPRASAGRIVRAKHRRNRPRMRGTSVIAANNGCAG